MTAFTVVGYGLSALRRLCVCRRGRIWYIVFACCCYCWKFSEMIFCVILLPSRVRASPAREGCFHDTISFYACYCAEKYLNTKRWYQKTFGDFIYSYGGSMMSWHRIFLCVFVIAQNLLENSQNYSEWHIYIIIDSWWSKSFYDKCHNTWICAVISIQLASYHFPIQWKNSRK